MKGIILAAGRGSRLGGLTDERPKCLVPLAGRSLLAWQRAALMAAGVEELAVVAGYRAELLASDQWKVFIAARWAETNMVMSLCAAASWLRAAPCLVSYGDVVYSEMTARHLIRAPGDLAISYDPRWADLWTQRFSDPLVDAETFRLAADGSLCEVGGHAGTVGEIEGQYMGLLRFTPPAWAVVEATLEALSPGRRDNVEMTGLLQRLIDAGHKITAVPCTGGWGEIDNERDLELCESLVAAGLLKFPREVS